MDVAAVFARMMQLPVILNRLETAAEAQLTDTDCQRLSALVFLHDIGKLHPGFQAKGRIWPPGLWHWPKRGHLKEGWAFLTLASKRSEHPFHETMRQVMKWGEAVDPLVAAMIAHHGRPVEPPSDPTLHDWPCLPHYDWQAEAGVMDDALHRWFAGAFGLGAGPLPNNPRFHHTVAGFVALADWIGSDKRFFPFKEPFDPTYDAVARRAARKALETIGLDPGALVALTCAELRGKLTEFGRGQSRAQVRSGGCGSRRRNLLILEAETGAGKTEAALWRFTQLLAAEAVSGLYFAVPTRAAARQLHGRVDKALRRVFGAAGTGSRLGHPRHAAALVSSKANACPTGA